ncbi:hypothetical protein FCM35_KLT00397 [Carex littledalei]|uniref:RRM domain-containing protein n=1 Tax=Carex littledalei TaxID=544730 RepID=A0A833W390_9POAL|nr:hypothetical protein FCM35_KLT00397 [Carex littledalei]
MFAVDKQTFDIDLCNFQRGANVPHLPALPPQGGASIVPSQNGTNVYQSPPGATNIIINAPNIQQSSLVPPRRLHPDKRTFFVTFSNGSQLTADELLNFFRTRYRIEAESVYIEEPSTIRDPQYAHVTFYNPESVEYVLNGHAKEKFRANGKHLRACRFIPRRWRRWGQNAH